MIESGKAIGEAYFLVENKANDPACGAELELQFSRQIKFHVKDFICIEIENVSNKNLTFKNNKYPSQKDELLIQKQDMRYES